MHDLPTLVPYLQFLFGGLEIMKRELNTGVFYIPAMCRGHLWTSHKDVDSEKFSKAPINSKSLKVWALIFLAFDFLGS